MKPNPGGIVAPDQVVGRDELIDHIWRRLEVQSLSLNAERRVGKTSVLRKMEKEPRDGWVPIYQDVSKVNTASEFVALLLEQVHGQLSRWNKIKQGSRKLFEQLGGTEIGGVLTLPKIGASQWKRLFEQVVVDLMQNQAPNRVVFFWDEFPWMIEKIRDSDGQAMAIEILDLLRAIRQTHPEFRVIYTGSVGIHHILGDLQSKGYGNEPMNDMGPTIDVLPLDVEPAHKLASWLLASAHHSPANESELAEQIASGAGYVPYYIHAIVDQTLAKATAPDWSVDVKAMIKHNLVSADDPWDMRHYDQRIPHYYKGQAEVVRIILDTLATRDEPASSQDVNDAIAQIQAPPKREDLRDLLRRLVLDHYLEKTDDSRYGFRFPLVKRWWGLERELPGIA